MKLNYQIFKIYTQKRNIWEFWWVSFQISLKIDFVHMKVNQLLLKKEKGKEGRKEYKDLGFGHGPISTIFSFDYWVWRQSTFQVYPRKGFHWIKRIVCLIQGYLFSFLYFFFFGQILKSERRSKQWILWVILCLLSVGRDVFGCPFYRIWLIVLKFDCFAESVLTKKSSPNLLIQNPKKPSVMSDE